MEILNYILALVYFFLPAYLANMTPPLLKKANIFNFLAKPVDFGRKLGEFPIFGANKTWRGLTIGVLIGMHTAIVQGFLFQNPVIKNISLIDYNSVNILVFGFLMSFGALFGDLFFSFLKRRLKLNPGDPWLPFDQTNYVIGAFLLIDPYLKLKISIWMEVFVLTFFLHLAVNYLGYLWGLHKAKL